jgi:hypothetical protein
MRQVELAFDEDLVALLRRLYYDEDLTLGQIATRIHKQLGRYVPSGTLGGWMVRFELDRAQMARRAARSEVA